MRAGRILPDQGMCVLFNYLSHGCASLDQSEGQTSRDNQDTPVAFLCALGWYEVLASASMVWKTDTPVMKHEIETISLTFQCWGFNHKNLER